MMAHECLDVIVIGYALPLYLRHRLTPLRLTLNGKPWFFGVIVFRYHFRYSCQHYHFRSLQLSLTTCLRWGTECSATVIHRLVSPSASVPSLGPLHLQCNWPRLVSCYAFLRWWLLLVLHPNCRWSITSFHLAWTWGPYLEVWVVSLSSKDVSAHGVAVGYGLTVFGVWSMVGANARGSSSALPLSPFVPTTYLNRFRREPAISEFDWPFTPNHKSSQHFATCKSSILPSTLVKVQSVRG